MARGGAAGSDLKAMQEARRVRKSAEVEGMEVEGAADGVFGPR